MKIKALIDIVLPPRCPLSGECVDSPGMLSPSVWKKLSFISDPVCSACGVPFDFTIDTQGMVCASCLKNRPAYDHARSALVYEETSRDLILGFKHGDQTQNVHAFIPWLKMAGAPFWPEADVLIPVPLHWTRLLRRRYNQSALMAQALGKDMNIPVHLSALARQRATPTQGHLKAKDRARNVRAAFIVRPQFHTYIKDKNIVLMDDVYTTGSTVKECAQALRAAGAGQVNVLTLARVIKPHTLNV